jgi:FkbM family methyltransferase
MLGDVLGFCAAAHLLHLKVNDIIKVHFQESRKDITKYFDGIEWVPKNEIPDAIDCGTDPTISEWPNMNGVKRFYRFMDPTLAAPKTFDVHMKAQKREGKYIGLITNSHTQGCIDNEVAIKMCDDARAAYPGLPIILLGEKSYECKIPPGVEDRRDDKPDFDALVEQIKDLKLLLTPQTGPCFIAVGLGIEMWVYKSKETFWDYVLNYDTYKVARWYDRPSKFTNTVVTDSKYNSTIPYIIRQDTWDGSIVHLITDEYHISPDNSISSIIDIGAHIGGFSKRASVYFPNAKILAFEPQLDNYLLLLRNVVQNQNVIPYNIGVTGKSFQLKLWRTQSNNTGAISFKEGEGQIPAIPINCLLNEFQSVDIVKVDCEGSEFDIFLNINTNNLRKIKRIIGELHEGEKYRYPVSTWTETGEQLLSKLLPGFKIIFRVPVFEAIRED